MIYIAKFKKRKRVNKKKRSDYGKKRSPLGLNTGLRNTGTVLGSTVKGAVKGANIGVAAGVLEGLAVPASIAIRSQGFGSQEDKEALITSMVAGSAYKGVKRGLQGAGIGGAIGAGRGIRKVSKKTDYR